MRAVTCITVLALVTISIWGQEAPKKRVAVFDLLMRLDVLLDDEGPRPR